jgi:hypothetical protein
MPLAILFMLIALSAPALAADPFIGAWKMDAAKSDYKSNPREWDRTI